MIMLSLGKIMNMKKLGFIEYKQVWLLAYLYIFAIPYIYMDSTIDMELKRLGNWRELFPQLLIWIQQRDVSQLD